MLTSNRPAHCAYNTKYDTHDACTADGNTNNYKYIRGNIPTSINRDIKENPPQCRDNIQTDKSYINTAHTNSKNRNTKNHKRHGGGWLYDNTGSKTQEPGGSSAAQRQSEKLEMSRCNMKRSRYRQATNEKSLYISSSFDRYYLYSYVNPPDFGNMGDHYKIYPHDKLLMYSKLHPPFPCDQISRLIPLYAVIFNMPLLLLLLLLLILLCIFRYKTKSKSAGGIIETRSYWGQDKLFERCGHKRGPSIDELRLLKQQKKREQVHLLQEHEEYFKYRFVKDKAVRQRMKKEYEEKFRKTMTIEHKNSYVVVTFILNIMAKEKILTDEFTKIVYQSLNSTRNIDLMWKDENEKLGKTFESGFEKIAGQEAFQELSWIDVPKAPDYVSTHVKTISNSFSTRINDTSKISYFVDSWLSFIPCLLLAVSPKSVQMRKWAYEFIRIGNMFFDGICLPSSNKDLGVLMGKNNPNKSQKSWNHKKHKNKI
jgi:hypothetical protein